MAHFEFSYVLPKGVAGDICAEIPRLAAFDNAADAFIMNTVRGTIKDHANDSAGRVLMYSIPQRSVAGASHYMRLLAKEIGVIIDLE